MFIIVYFCFLVKQQAFQLLSNFIKTAIEQKTGFDFFANLPESLAASAEANVNWSTFKNF